MKDPSPSQAVAADTPSSGGVGVTLGPYVVKLPKQSRVKLRRHGRRAKVKPTPSDLPSSASPGISKDSVPFVDVGSGHGDQFLFDNPCDNPTPLLNLPSSLRRNIKNNRKIRTPHRQPVEQCEPGPSTLEREHSRISDTSSESLSVCPLTTRYETRIHDIMSRTAFPLSLLRRHRHLSVRML